MYQTPGRRTGTLLIAYCSKNKSPTLLPGLQIFLSHYYQFAVGHLYDCKLNVI